MPITAFDRVQIGDVAGKAVAVVQHIGRQLGAEGAPTGLVAIADTTHHGGVAVVQLFHGVVVAVGGLEMQWRIVGV
ncbi:hypothetical protein D3C80_1506910 [compost metagenome]